MLNNYELVLIYSCYSQKQFAYYQHKMIIGKILFFIKMQYLIFWEVIILKLITNLNDEINNSSLQHFFHTDNKNIKYTWK